MATIAKKTTPKANKETLAQDIIKKLTVALASYKDAWGEKKFESRIKKASKLFLKGKPKKIKVKKAASPAKKKAVKKVVPVAKKKATVRPAKKAAVKKAAPVKK